MARVLKPGGVLILTDSIQLGDRLPLDGGIGKFQDFNEPWYVPRQHDLPKRSHLSCMTNTLLLSLDTSQCFNPQQQITIFDRQ